VWPFFMIMAEKFSDGRPEMPFAEEHHSLQALGLGGFDKPFGKGVQIGTPGRQDERLHTTVAQQAPEGRGVQRIAVQDDVLHAAQEAVAGGRRHHSGCGETESSVGCSAESRRAALCSRFANPNHSNHLKMKPRFR
jgi:hypothetical protein